MKHIFDHSLFVSTMVGPEIAELMDPYISQDAAAKLLKALPEKTGLPLVDVWNCIIQRLQGVPH